MLRRGGALAAHTSLEVVEATRLLLAARPLARALADRGRHELTTWDDLETVADRAMEAVVLAGGVA
jgi:hypothetical protein